MLNLNKQKTNIRNTINSCLDNFLYTKNPYFDNDKTRYFSIHYNDFQFNFIKSKNVKEHINFNFTDESFRDIYDLEGILRNKYDIEKVKRSVISNFLKSTEKEPGKCSVFCETLNEHFSYNKLDIKINPMELVSLLEDILFLPESKKYKIDITQQMIKTAYCRYTKDTLNYWKLPKDDSFILEHLKCNQNNTPVLDYVFSLNATHNLKEYNITPYLYQVMKEEVEISYLHSYIRKTLRNATLVSKVKSNRINEVLGSYDDKCEYDITRHEVYCLYHYSHYSLEGIISFITEDYYIYEVDKKTKVKELKESFIPVLKLNNKVYVQKIIKILKKNY